MTDDLSHDDERRALVAEYVLGLLSVAEHDRVRRAIADSPSLQAEHEFWITRFSRFDDDYAEVTPPPLLYPTIETRLFGPAAQPRRSLWDNLALWRALAAGAMAIAVLSLGFAIIRPTTQPVAPTDQLVAMLEEQGTDVRIAAIYDGAGNVRLTALSGAAVPGQDYELWAIQGGNAPVSLGILPIDRPSTFAISPALLEGWAEGSVLAVTLEPLGGAPGGVPTGPIMAKGAVTRI